MQAFAEYVPWLDQIPPLSSVLCPPFSSFLLCTLPICPLPLSPLPSPPADPPEKLQQTCPACPLLLPVDSPRAVHAAGLTLYKFNTQSTLPSSLALQNLTRASVQVASLAANLLL